MTDRQLSSDANPLRRRAGCPDLDPNWPDVTGAPRGPRVCVLYPKCKCGKEDRAMTERSQPGQLPSNPLYSPTKAAREWAQRRGRADDAMLIEAWTTGWNSRCIPEEPGALADHLRSMLLDGTVQCPLCGKTGPHPHSPEEIVIYRNGVKYGRSLKSASDETPACIHPVGDLYYHGFVSGTVGDFRCNLCDEIIQLPHGPRVRAAQKARCGLCAEGMNSFTDPDTGKKMHARNGVVTVCTAQSEGDPR